MALSASAGTSCAPIEFERSPVHFCWEDVTIEPLRCRGGVAAGNLFASAGFTRLRGK